MTPNNPPSQVDALTLDEISFRVSPQFALREVSFSVRAGTMCMLLGANGAGKSTLFSIACGLFHPNSGNVSIGGASVVRESRRALAQLGIVFQQSTLDLDLTVAQNLRYHASLHGIRRAAAQERVERDLQRNGLSQYLNTKVARLSGGERRRVELVRALMHEPKLLLMDEATSGLDISRRLAFIDDVRTLCRERDVGVLWATHLGDEVGLVDDVAVLHQGQLVEHGNAADLLERTSTPSIERLYESLINEHAA